ncbi:MAG: DUF418 domain-containing protein [Chitinophagaceae bacterium]|nr:MAG: DUF418 domain-containing protein [Chitinophagaceae bacterium]
MHTKLSLPVNLNDRAIILDILRGFAILGILIDNLTGFTGYSYFTTAQKQALPTFYADNFLNTCELIFVRGKFYSMFSLLFGIGFSIILARHSENGTHSLKLFYRRLLVLLIIATVHITLIWEGDILFLYAVLGLALPLFRNCANRTLLIWAAALLLSPLVIDFVKVLFNFRLASFLENLAFSIDKKNGIPLDDTFSTYLFKEGSGWQEWRNWLQSGWIYRFSFLIESNRIPKVFGMFLLGFYAGKNLIYANLDAHLPLFKTIRKWGFSVGIPFSIVMAYFEYDGYFVPEKLGLLDTLCYTFSVVPLSLAYVSAICLFWIKVKGNGRLNYLAPVGRMALTNYLMHSVICIGLCYGVGLGWGGKIGPSLYFPLALCLYTVQMIISNWWFKHFAYGPIEWLWRQLTYGKKLTLRKEV